MITLIVKMKHVTFYLFNANHVQKMNNCCSDQCANIIEMPLEEQKIIRKGTHNSNKIFKKGRSKSLSLRIEKIY